MEGGGCSKSLEVVVISEGEERWRRRERREKKGEGRMKEGV